MTNRTIRKRHKWHNNVCAFCGLTRITEKHPTINEWTVQIIVDVSTGEINEKGYCLTNQIELL